MIVFPGRTAQDLVINPITGGYDLTGCRVYISKPRDIIDLTKDNSKMNTKNTNTNKNITVQQEKNTQNTHQNTSMLTLFDVNN